MAELPKPAAAPRPAGSRRSLPIAAAGHRRAGSGSHSRFSEKKRVFFEFS